MSTLTPSSLPPALNDTPLPPLISASTWTFTQGFVLGQASFLILVGVFIKYVVFENAEKNRQRKLDRGKRPPLSTTNVPSPTSLELMDKVGYDMASHASESGDFLNVLLAQILQGYRDDLLGSGGEEGARRRVESWLNPANSTLSWLDPISVTSLNLGNTYPLLSNARIRPADGQGGIRLEVDVDYSDSLHLSLATSLLVNFPLPKFAVLPVALGVELVGVGGTLSIRVHNPPGGANRQQHVHMSLLPDFHLNVKTTSLLGSRAKLQDIPKLEQLVVSRLRAVIHDKLVWPRYVEFSLPRLQGLHVESAKTNGSRLAADMNDSRSDNSPSLHITTPSVNAAPQPLNDAVTMNTSPTSGLSLSPTSRKIRMPPDFRGHVSAAPEGSTVPVHGFAAPTGKAGYVDGFPRGNGGMSSVVDIADAHGVNAQIRHRGASSMAGSLPAGLSSTSHLPMGHANGPASFAAGGRDGRMGALNARNSRAVTGHA